MRTLDVYINEMKAGVLAEEFPGNGYTFTYTDEYMQTPYPSVAVALPKKQKLHKSEHLFPFFVNILPEGSLKKALCRANRIDEDDDFGLLTAVSDWEFAGGVDIKKSKE